MSDDAARAAAPSDFKIGDVVTGVPFGIGVARITAICSADDPDPDEGDAHEPLACVGEHFPASWESPVPCEITRLRAELAAARSEIGGLRLLIEAMEMSYRAALADAGGPKFDGPNWRDDPLEKTPIVRGYKPTRVVAPLHRAIAATPGAYGLRVGMEF